MCSTHHKSDEERRDERDAAWKLSQAATRRVLARISHNDGRTISPSDARSRLALALEKANAAPFAEVPPATDEKLYLPLDADSEAVITITIKTRGLGAIDPPTRRAPTAKELHHIADLLARRAYQFHPDV